ncbi:MAG: ABC transporter ATP-binding protein [Planctomycetota bacterium]
MSSVASSSPAVELRGVEKRFGDLVAVDRLDLQIPRGSVFGFIGPNGAGKTTTIRMIMDIIRPDAGEILFLGEPRTRESMGRIGYLPEERGLYKKMKVGWTLEYFARLKGITDRREIHARGDRWLDRFGLLDRKKDNVEALSKGNQQKLQFVTTVLHEPDLVILDEPFSGLDPVNANLLTEIIAELKQAGHTVIFSTHVMEQAEKVCEYVFMIAGGHKVLDGPLSEIKATHRKKTVLLELEGVSAADAADATPEPSELAELREVSCVADAKVRVAHARGVIDVTLKEDATLGELLQGLSSRTDVLRVERKEPALHDIFLELAGRTDSTGRKLEEATS